MPQNLLAAPKQSRETMSPSRLRFIKEHSTSPFANEVFLLETLLMYAWMYVITNKWGYVMMALYDI